MISITEMNVLYIKVWCFIFIKLKMIRSSAYLGHRQPHPEQLFSQLKQSSSKHKNKVCAISNLLLLHVGGHHQHFGSRVLHLFNKMTFTNIVFSFFINHSCRQHDEKRFLTSSSLRIVAASLVTNSFSKWLMTILFIPKRHQCQGLASTTFAVKALKV